MTIIFCSDPLHTNRPDPSFEDEIQAVRTLGLELSLISFEALLNEADANSAVRGVLHCETPELAIYRGWMLRPQQYQEFYSALHAPGICLINTPEA